MNMPDEINKIIDGCIERYNGVVCHVHQKAQGQTGRSPGGMIRAMKAKMLEEICKNLIEAAWIKNGDEKGRLEFDLYPKYDIPIRSDYVKNLEDKELKECISEHLSKYKVRHGTDIHVYVNREFVLSVECKVYTENAMLKRVLFDAYLLQTKFQQLKFALVQLESQLTGDYSSLPANPKGSRSTHTLLSHMSSVDLKIITLLKGERKVNEPIHEPDFYKPLERENLEKAILEIKNLLC